MSMLKVLTRVFVTLAINWRSMAGDVGQVGCDVAYSALDDSLLRDE